jgi:hypothetical protein
VLHMLVVQPVDRLSPCSSNNIQSVSIQRGYLLLTLGLPTRDQ